MAWMQAHSYCVLSKDAYIYVHIHVSQKMKKHYMMMYTGVYYEAGTISMVQAPSYILWADGHRGFSVHTV